MTKIVNLTPHAVNIVGGATYEPSGAVARVEETLTPVGQVEGIPLYEVSYGKVEGLPQDTSPEVLYIVSAMVRAACPGRTNLASPGAPVRNSAGQVVGCRGLIVNPQAVSKGF